MKKLVYHDEMLYRSRKDEIENNVMHINTALAAYETMGIGSIDAKTYKDFLNPDAMQGHITNSVSKALDKANIQINSIREAAIGNALEEFETKCLPSIRLVNNIYLSPITFENGRAVFTEARDKMLKEQCSNYLESVEAEKFYNLVKQITTDLNHLTVITKKVFFPSMFNQLFYTDKEGVLKARDEINYNGLAAMQAEFEAAQKQVETIAAEA